MRNRLVNPLKRCRPRDACERVSSLSNKIRYLILRKSQCAAVLSNEIYPEWIRITLNNKTSDKAGDEERCSGGVGTGFVTFDDEERSDGDCAQHRWKVIAKDGEQVERLGLVEDCKL